MHYLSKLEKSQILRKIKNTCQKRFQKICRVHAAWKSQCTLFLRQILNFLGFWLKCRVGFYLFWTIRQIFQRFSRRSCVWSYLRSLGAEQHWARTFHWWPRGGGSEGDFGGSRGRKIGEGEIAWASKEQGWFWQTSVKNYRKNHRLTGCLNYGSNQKYWDRHWSHLLTWSSTG